MSFWYESSAHSKDARYWTDLAILLARDNGFNKFCVLQKMQAKERKLCKRIWWSCFTRDQLVGWGTRRAPLINQDEHDVPMLTLEDFDIEDLSQNDLNFFEETGTARNMDKQKQVATLFIEKTKLCVCIGSVLDPKSMPTAGEHSFDGDVHQPDIALEVYPDLVENLQEGDAKLVAWVGELPETATYRPYVPMDVLRSGEKTMAVHLSLLHLLYHATVSALHRSYGPHGSRSKVRSSAAAITNILENLRRLDLIRYIPITSFTFITPALTIHLLDQKSPDSTIRQCAAEDFAKCLRAMRELSDDYEDSEPAVPRAPNPNPTKKISTSDQVEKEVAKAVNPGPGVSFYSILDDITDLIPPTPQLPKQPKPLLVQSSKLTLQDTFLPPAQDYLQDGFEGDLEMDFPALVLSPNYEDFLNDDML
jgi:hypothetical protein